MKRRPVASDAQREFAAHSLLMTQSYQQLEPHQLGTAARLRQDRHGPALLFAPLTRMDPALLALCCSTAPPDPVPGRLEWDMLSAGVGLQFQSDSYGAIGCHSMSE